MNRSTIRKAVDAWHKAAISYAEFGAYDTEPRNVYAREVTEYAKDPLQEIPNLSADEWDLYTKSRDCDAAADALNLQLAATCRAVKDAGGLCGITYGELCYGS